MAPRWSDEMNIKFVKLYRQHECLWDQCNGMYSNKFTRQCALVDIASKMNLEEFGSSEVNRKIKSLRATYHSEMKKYASNEKSGCGNEDSYTTALKWFEDMRYIIATGTLKRKSARTETDSCMSPRAQSKCRMYTIQAAAKVPFKRLKTQHDSRAEEDTASESGEISEEQDLISEQGMEDDFHHQLSATVNNNITDDGPQGCMTKCAKPRSTIVQHISATPRELRLISPSVSTPVTHENEFDIFGKHVASQLKQLKVEYAVTAIGEINKILTQKRLASLLGNAKLNDC